VSIREIRVNPFVFMTLGEAQLLGASVLAQVRPFCVVAEIAGSTRREKPDGLKDVEIVAVPRSLHLFELAHVVNREWGRPSEGKFPSKYTRLRGAVNLDLFWCTPETFGLVFFIRTGSDEFAQSALARWKQLTGGGYSECARLHSAAGVVQDTPDEAAVFRLLQLDFIPPKLRNGRLP